MFYNFLNNLYAHGYSDSAGLRKMFSSIMEGEIRVVSKAEALAMETYTGSLANTKLGIVSFGRLTDELLDFAPFFTIIRDKTEKDERFPVNNDYDSSIYDVERIPLYNQAFNLLPNEESKVVIHELLDRAHSEGLISKQERDSLKLRIISLPDLMELGDSEIEKLTTEVKAL